MGGASADYPTSATTEPLISKNFPSYDDPSAGASSSGNAEGKGHHLIHPPLPYPGDDDSFLQYPPVSFLHGPRPCRDLPFLIFFLLLVISTLALGIFSVVHRNPHFSHASAFSYDPSSSSCFLPTSTSYDFELNSLRIFRGGAFLEDLITTLVATFVLSIPISLFLLWLLKHYAKQVVYACLPFFVLIPAAVNIFWFTACALDSGCRNAFPLAYRILGLIFVFLIIAVIAWIIIANWHRVELTIHIIRIAAAALSANVWLFAVLPLLVLGLAAFCAPVVVFLVFARMNGDIIPKQRNGDYYCGWKQNGWVPAYFALGVLTMLWALAVTIEAQVYVISGTVAQWYFTKDGEKPHRSIRTSLRYAFGPSFGTVCFSGLIMAVIRVIRGIVDSAKQENQSAGFINIMIRCCANAFFASVDFVNKFTINFAAITGDSYCDSAMMSYELLKRNLLSAVFVETVSTRILAGIIFVLSAIYAVVVCAILKAVTSLDAEAYAVSALALVLLIIVSGFLVHVLDNVIDTIYVCYAIDKDKGEVCKQEVHEVYAMLPISRNGRPALATRTTVLV